MLTWIASCTCGSAARKVSVPLLDCYSRAVCRAWLGVIRPCTGRFCCTAILHGNAPLPWCDDGNRYCTVPPLHGDYLGRPLGEYRSVHAYATARSMAPLSTEANTLSLAVMHYAFQHIRNYAIQKAVLEPLTPKSGARVEKALVQATAAGVKCGELTRDTTSTNIPSLFPQLPTEMWDVVRSNSSQFCAGQTPHTTRDVLPAVAVETAVVQPHLSPIA
jgi:hypothetical protein